MSRLVLPGGNRCPGNRCPAARRESGRRPPRGPDVGSATVAEIQPELWVEQAAAAVAFYQAAFGATVLHLVGEGDDIVAQLAVGNAVFWVAQAEPEGLPGPEAQPGTGADTGRPARPGAEAQAGPSARRVAEAQVGASAQPSAGAGLEAERKRYSPRAIGGATGRTLLVVDDPDSVVAQAVAAGAHGTAEVGIEHGWRLGRIIDPFGHEWEIGRPERPWPPG